MKQVKDNLIFLMKGLHIAKKIAYISFMQVEKEFFGEDDTFTFEMVNTINELDLNIYIGPYIYYYLNGGKPGSCLFNFGRADHIDSLLVNGIYLKNVYKYLTSPSQEIVAETYLHQGKGLVKITYRNGQEFELLEHIKVDD